VDALKFLASIVGMSVVAAAAITFLVSLAIDPLERMRLRWAERDRESVKVARV
jgi:hypothetical protein